jgi:hypothetical protein
MQGHEMAAPRTRMGVAPWGAGLATCDRGAVPLPAGSLVEATRLSFVRRPDCLTLRVSWEMRYLLSTACGERSEGAVIRGPMVIVQSPFPVLASASTRPLRRWSGGGGISSEDFARGPPDRIDWRRGDRGPEGQRGTSQEFLARSGVIPDRWRRRGLW